METAEVVARFILRYGISRTMSHLDNKFFFLLIHNIQLRTATGCHGIYLTGI